EIGQACFKVTCGMMKRDPAVKSVPHDGWDQRSEPQKGEQIGTAGFQEVSITSAHRRKHKYEDNKPGHHLFAEQSETNGRRKGEPLPGTVFPFFQCCPEHVKGKRPEAKERRIDGHDVAQSGRAW